MWHGSRMSDESRGPGWWMASDGKWYPPESKPNALPPPSAPTLGVGSQRAFLPTSPVGWVVLVVVLILALWVVWGSLTAISS